MTIPMGAIGSIPRPLPLLEAIAARGNHGDSIQRLEATGSPVSSDAEQRKDHNFWTSCVDGFKNTAPDGFTIPSAVGQVYWMLRLTAGADEYLDVAKCCAHVQLKQPVCIPVARLGRTDDCGFPPFCDDISTTHETAFAKIRARVEGTKPAGKTLGGR